MTTNRDVQESATTGVCLADGGEAEQRLRAALRESEQRFRTLADAAPVLIWMSGTSKEGVYFNQTWLEFTGKPLETQLGEGWLELVHPEDRQRLFDVCMEGFRNRTSFTTEFRLRRADGEYRWLLDTGTPRFAPDGAFAGFIGSCVDITDRKLAEQALRESEERFARFMQHLPGLAWIKDAEGRYLFANESAQRAFQKSPCELYGRTDEEIFHSETAAKFRQNDRQAIESGTVVETIETLEHEDGLIHHSLVSKFPIPGPSPASALVGGMAIDVTDRIAAERALRESEERYRAIVEGQTEMVCRFRPDGTILFVNGAYARARSTSPEALAGANFWDFVDEEDRPNVLAMLDRLRPDSPEIRIENRFKSCEGTRWTLWTNRGLAFDAGGRAVEVQSSGIDITDRKRVEEALSASEERLRNAVDAADVGTWRVDLRTGLDTRDASLNRILGLDARESTQPVEDFFSRVLPEDRPQADQAWQSAMRGDGLYDVVVRLLRPDGEVRWIRDRGRVVHGSAGEPLYATGAITDITERKQAEEALRQSEDRKAAIFESAIDCLITMDHEGRIVDFNPAAERTFGYRREEVVGRTVADTIIPLPLRQEHRNGLESYLRTGESRVLGRLIEMPVLRADGRQFPAEISIAAINPSDGPPFFTAFIRDITERKRAERALKEADRRKDEFLATLAHELRNPLAPVRHAVQVFRLKGPDLPELEWAYDVIDRQIEQMTRLIDDLLDVSRISRGKIELRRERVTLTEVVRAAVEASRPLIDEREHELAIALPPGPVLLNADLTRLSQVFLNLLTNAAKYTERGGRIELVAKLHDPEVIVSVKDTGIGIPGDKLTKVFEMFAQIENPLTRSGSGLGIGLSLVKRLVEMHGGTIEAYSEGLGRGSTFVVHLPVASAQQASPKPGGNNGEDRPATRLRILVVDDNQAAATTLSMLLKITGNTVRIAHDGEEALTAAEEFHPEVVLLDIGMPKRNGYEVCRQIRNSPWGGDLMLIAITGWGQDEDKRLAVEAGFDHHLVKPVDPQVLMKLLATAQVRLAEPLLTLG